MRGSVTSDGKVGSTLAANANEPRPWKRADSVLGILSLSLGVAPVVLLGILCLVAWVRLRWTAGLVAR